MAHLLELGVDRMASTQLQTVWHRGETAADGRLVEVPLRADDLEGTLLEMSAYVWPHDADNDVDRMIAIQTIDGTAIESHLATLSPSGRVLGVVTSGYETIPFKVIMSEWLLALARAGGIPETLGTFDGGRNFFASMQVADEWRVPGDHSATRPLFNLVGNHTGQSAIRGSFCNFRVVCANTSAAYSRAHEAMAQDAQARAKQAWVSIRHTISASERMADAVAWIVDGRARVESEQALMARLASKLVSRPEVEAFVDSYISIPEDASKRATTIRQGARESFQGVLNDINDLGNHVLGSKGITAYGLLQAVTRFEDWESAVKAAGQPVGTRRAFRAFLGERETEKAVARDHICELVGVRQR